MNIKVKNLKSVASIISCIRGYWLFNAGMKSEEFKIQIFFFLTQEDD